MKQMPSVECKLDGPYLVKGLNDLRNSRGNSIPTKSVIALCRCGGSANKPFCDGTHQENGFSGAKLVDGSADRRDTYQGQRITIHDNRACRGVQVRERALDRSERSHNRGDY